MGDRKTRPPTSMERAALGSVPWRRYARHGYQGLYRPHIDLNAIHRDGDSWEPEGGLPWPTFDTEEARLRNRVCELRDAAERVGGAAAVEFLQHAARIERRVLRMEGWPPPRPLPVAELNPDQLERVRGFIDGEQGAEAPTPGTPRHQGYWAARWLMTAEAAQWMELAGKLEVAS